MDLRKMYGVVSALGKRLGDAEREKGGLLADLRATESRDEFLTWIREADTGLPDKLIDGFADTVEEDDWERWRARVLLQAKMVAAGEKPAPGHESGTSPMGGD